MTVTMCGRPEEYVMLTVCVVCIVCIDWLIVDCRLPTSHFKLTRSSEARSGSLPSVARVLVRCYWLDLSPEHTMSACVGVWCFRRQKMLVVTKQMMMKKNSVKQYVMSYLLLFFLIILRTWRSVSSWLNLWRHFPHVPWMCSEHGLCKGTSGMIALSTCASCC